MGDERKILSLPSPTSQQHSDSACGLFWVVIFNIFAVERSTRGEKPVHYTLQIQSLSLLKTTLAKLQRERYETQEFTAGGHKWKLALYPNGDEKRNGSGHISLYLVMADNAMLSTVSQLNVVFTFLVYDNLRDRYLTIQDGKVRRFHALKVEWGFEKLISLDTFNDASNGLLVDDCCAFGVDILVMKCNTNEGKGEVFSLVKQPINNKFTWKIINFSKAKLLQSPCESSLFTVENHNWKIRMDSQGCSKSTADSLPLALSLILATFNQVPRGFHVYAEYELTVMRQFGDGLEKVTYKCWFNGEEKGLGSPNFMSLSNLTEPMKGFIHNDTMIVEVKINVISTLKNLS